MSDINVRYTVMGALIFEGCFNVRDGKEERIICLCNKREDAGLIAGTLNKAWEQLEQDRIAVEELGG